MTCDWIENVRVNSPSISRHQASHSGLQMPPRLGWDGTVVVAGGTAGGAVVSTLALTAAQPGYQWASLVVLPSLQALLLLEGRKKQKWAPTGNTWAKWLKVRRLSWLVWQNNFTKIIYKSKVRQSCRVAIFLSGIFRDRKPRHHLYKSNGEYHYQVLMIMTIQTISPSYQEAIHLHLQPQTGKTILMLKIRTDAQRKTEKISRDPNQKCNAK